MTKHANKKIKLTDTRDTFKPFQYPEFYELWLKHEQVHWLHLVVPMNQDIADYKNRISEDQKKFLIQILRLFTQSDIDVAGAYVNNYLPIFPQPEIRMMLLGFAAREAVHVAAYSHLMESLGFPDSVYNEFLEYKEMADKHDFFNQITGTDHNQIIQQMCAVSAFTEGMQLFSSFVMLLNFGRNNLMPGMTKIVTWSIIDESCLIKDTEVLTPSGWKKIQDITTDDRIFQFDINSGSTEFVYPTHTTHVQRSESYLFESPTLHQHTTADHRMIYIDDEDCMFYSSTAEHISDNLSLVLNGFKEIGDDDSTNIDIFSDTDKSTLESILTGKQSTRVLYEQIEFISSKWAESAVKYCVEWLSNVDNIILITEDIITAINTLANIAGGVIVDNKFEYITSTKISKVKLVHDPLDFYCLTVPGTAFIIRSQGKISVTGNCHCEGMTKLFRIFVKENRDIWNDELKGQLYSIAEKMVELEDGFINLAYGLMDGSEFKLPLLKKDMHSYIRYIADRRLIALGLKGIFKHKKNPLPWVDEMLVLPSHTNFFEQQESSYSKGALTGTWDDVWGVVAN